MEGWSILVTNGRSWFQLWTHEVWISPVTISVAKGGGNSPLPIPGVKWNPIWRLHIFSKGLVKNHQLVDDVWGAKKNNLSWSISISCHEGLGWILLLEPLVALIFPQVISYNSAISACQARWENWENSRSFFGLDEKWGKLDDELDIVHSLKLTVRPWKLMVWILSRFLLGWPIFRAYVSFREVHPGSWENEHFEPPKKWKFCSDDFPFQL